MNPAKVDRSQLRGLTDLPNISKEMAKDLRLLGYARAEDINGENPFEMYARLCELTGVRHDACVIDVFRRNLNGICFLSVHTLVLHGPKHQENVLADRQR